MPPDRRADPMWSHDFHEMKKPHRLIGEKSPIWDELTPAGRFSIAKCLMEEEFGHEETPGHVGRMATMVKKIVTELTKKEVIKGIHPDQAAIAGALHDRGKIDPEVLRVISPKKKLTDADRIIMQEHTTIGEKMLQKRADGVWNDGAASWILRSAAINARSHHERYDGTGYPDRLKGEAIPLLAQITALADAWDAMGSDRGYNEPLSKEEIDSEIERCEGSHFGPRAVEGYFLVIGREIEEERAKKEAAHSRILLRREVVRH